MNTAITLFVLLVANKYVASQDGYNYARPQNLLQTSSVSGVGDDNRASFPKSSPAEQGGGGQAFNLPNRQNQYDFRGPQLGGPAGYPGATGSSIGQNYPEGEGYNRFENEVGAGRGRRPGLQGAGGERSGFGGSFEAGSGPEFPSGVGVGGRPGFQENADRRNKFNFSGGIRSEGEPEFSRGTGSGRDPGVQEGFTGGDANLGFQDGFVQTNEPFFSTNFGPQDFDGNLDEGDYSAIPGIPGQDYPIYAEVPETSFRCDQQPFPGYYADVEAQCQVFHICANNKTYDFLCPNGTIFHQEYFVCVWWNQFDCSTAPQYYFLNERIYDYSIRGSDNQIGNQNFGIQTDISVPTFEGQVPFTGSGTTGFSDGGQAPVFGDQRPSVSSFGGSQRPQSGQQSPGREEGITEPASLGGRDPSRRPLDRQQGPITDSFVGTSPGTSFADQRGPSGSGFGTQQGATGGAAGYPDTKPTQSLRPGGFSSFETGFTSPGLPGTFETPQRSNARTPVDFKQDQPRTNDARDSQFRPGSQPDQFNRQYLPPF